MHTTFYGRILGWQPERVPTHWRKYVVPSHHLVTRKHIAHNVVATMTDVKFG
jgi:hypothetical protein